LIYNKNDTIFVSSIKKIKKSKMKTIQEISAIQKICKNIGLRKFEINFTDGSVDVNGNVNLRSGWGDGTMDKTPTLPVNFDKINGHFICQGIGLITLVGCPKEVGQHFVCAHQDILTLEGCPKKVKWNFICHWNEKLTSLEGLEDTKIDGDIHAMSNKNLYCLDGFPIDFKGQFNCEYTPIHPIYERYIKDTHFEGSNRLAQAINFFNKLRVIEEYNDGWRIHYRSFLEYLKRYKEFGKPTKEELQALVGNYYIVK
jgi:hypothetical protein